MDFYVNSDLPSIHNDLNGDPFHTLFVVVVVVAFRGHFLEKMYMPSRLILFFLGWFW
jgi:hypothetical protein